MFRRILVLISMISMSSFLLPGELAMANESVCSEATGELSEASCKGGEKTFFELLRENPEVYQVSDELRDILDLDWKNSGRHKLPKSNSTISLPKGYFLLIGDEAKKYRELSKEPSRDNLEANIHDSLFKERITIEFEKDGYVSIDDWENLDPKLLLKFTSESTEKANEERRKNGLSELHVIGWAQEPTLDKHTNTVYWAIEGVDSDDDDIFVNAVAIRLCRQGYERITWITQKDSYVPFGGHLDVILRAHSFDPGFRYKDYTTGDKVAEYGVATLVAATVGAKIVKAGGCAILFKKFGVFIAAGIALLWGRIKGIFKKNPKV